MSHLYLTEDGSSLNKFAESVQLKLEGKILFEIELKSIETVQVFANVNITTQVVREFMERGIELAYYANSGKLIGQLTPIHVKNVELRYKQYALSKNPDFKLEFSKEILRQKFISCIQLIRDGNKNRDDLNLNSELTELKSYIEKLEQTSSLDSLLGIEGSFAKRYYSVYGLLFKDMSLFNGRTKRPPKDEANAIMSFIYTLVTNRISSYIDGLGFDPYIGFYHAMEYGRVSLACDMIEPVRAIFCDRLTLGLFNLKILGREDFEMTEEGIRLTHESRKKFFQRYAEELEKIKDYRIVKGDFTEYIKAMIGWLRKIFEEGSVRRFYEE
ncbi:MAG: CRISPR-associated endonuclease Cas1 [Leptospiraceae bacterium]|nr:CRISPR-associated endonuclease Cas1 [Leptospiraceae bacterium]